MLIYLKLPEIYSVGNNACAANTRELGFIHACLAADRDYTNYMDLSRNAHEWNADNTETKMMSTDYLCVFL